MKDKPEGMTDLEIASEDYSTYSRSLDIAEALLKETSNILHRTALGVLIDNYYRLLDTGQVRLDRAREAEKG